jgi:hypothetical protein
VFSASLRGIRVVQAYVDNRDKSIKVKKSQVINMQDDMESDVRSKTELLLSWAIGTPVGATRYEDTTPAEY